jgi:hypothetical protein
MPPYNPLAMHRVREKRRALARQVQAGGITRQQATALYRAFVRETIRKVNAKG